MQSRAIKRIAGLRDLNYEEILKECGLTTMEIRRLRGDQIEVFEDHHRIVSATALIHRTA